MTGARVLGKVVVLLASVASGHRTQPHLATEPAGYRVAANGSAARVDERWDLRWPEDLGVGVITGMARCGNEVFLIDRDHLYRADLAAQGPLSVFGTEDIARPMAVVADCGNGRLYVVNGGSKSVVSLRTSSGAAVEKYSLPQNLIVMYSARLVQPDTFFVSGVWLSDGKPMTTLLKTPAIDTFFRPVSIGVKLSLKTRDVTPAFRPYDERCIGAARCLQPEFDLVSAPAGREPSAWVVGQPTSRAVGLYDRDGRLQRTIDVSSPLFVRDGVELSVDAKAGETERWRTRNSVIRQVYGLPDRIATVHTLAILGADWHSGDPIAFKVYANIHALDGTGLTSDIGLPDLPVGRDETHIYVVEYIGGRTGNRRAARLLRIPVTPGRDGFGGSGSRG